MTAKDMTNCIKTVFKSASGKKLLNYLVRSYVLSNVVGKDTETTYINLGKQQLIQEILEVVNLTDTQIEQIYGDM